MEEFNVLSKSLAKRLIQHQRTCEDIISRKFFEVAVDGLGTGKTLAVRDNQWEFEELLGTDFAMLKGYWEPYTKETFEQDQQERMLQSAAGCIIDCQEMMRVFMDTFDNKNFKKYLKHSGKIVRMWDLQFPKALQDLRNSCGHETALVVDSLEKGAKHIQFFIESNMSYIFQNLKDYVKCKKISFPEYPSGTSPTRKEWEVFTSALFGTKMVS